MRPQRNLLMILFLVASFLLAACTRPSTPPVQTTPLPATATSAPTAAPEQLIYVSGSSVDSDPAVAVMTQFAADNALQFKQVAAFDAATLTPMTRIVVLGTAPANLSEAVDANPKVQFILLRSSEITGKSNLSTLAAQPEEVYFMAGYLSTLIAYDWRSAGLVVSDSVLGVGAADAFANGGKFVCGKCNPVYPPLVDLPQVTALAANATSAEWLAAANAMLAYGVNVMFVDAPALTPEVVSALSAAKVTLIGTTSAPAGAESIWGATVSSDNSALLTETLAKAYKGEGGQQIAVPILLTNVNTTLVSPARQDLFNQTAAMLAAGNVGALSIP